MLNEGKRFRHLDLGIFLTPDPLEYVDGFNPYIYCNQNPWGKWDPEGLTIIITGTEEQQKKIRSHLDFISKNSPKAEKFIAQLKNSENKHTIIPINYEENKENKPKSCPDSLKDKSNNKGTGTSIYYDPEHDITFSHKFYGDETFKSSPEEVLAHELSHSSESDRGKNDRSIKDKLRDQPQTETNAIAVENEISKAKGKEGRVYHDTTKELARRYDEKRYANSKLGSKSKEIRDEDYKPNYKDKK